MTYSKVGHVSEEDTDLDDLLNRGASSLQDDLQAGNAGGSLLLDGSLNEVSLGVPGDLTGAVDGGGGLDGLGLLCVSWLVLDRLGHTPIFYRK